ncbi:hypothetical protein BV25DRAFT_1897758 [Artomyces pyxidatus]|uniref:Uncharacterized protein n=1 Tax=Artomyces pyxidatus TaxID=48021 RepID=A0ACB8TCR7_9AGAM|nr:hypothetical protein BV25DRAFT_1897758 [Artomyces pyxidatus]
MPNGVYSRDHHLVCFDYISVRRTYSHVFSEGLNYALPMHPQAVGDPQEKFLPRCTRGTLQAFCSFDKGAAAGGHDSLNINTSKEGAADLSTRVANVGCTESSVSAWNPFPISEFPNGPYPEDVERALAEREMREDTISDIAARGAIAPEHSRELPSLGYEGSQLFCAVLLMAERGTIYDIMSSALYHRHVLGVTEPIVGLTFEQGGHLLYVIIGWLEASGACNLPLVHVLHASFDITDHLLQGVFDLTDMSSALKLAHFIVSIKDHINSVPSSAEEAHKRIAKEEEHPSHVRWRADQVEIVAEESLSIDTLNCAVEAWRSRVEREISGQSDDDIKSSLHSRPIVGMGYDSNTPHISAQPHFSQTKLTPWHRATLESMDTRNTGLFFSRFAGRKEKKGESGAKDGATLWLFDRACKLDAQMQPIFFRGRYDEFIPRTDIPQSAIPRYLEFLPFYKCYDDATGLRWPQDWTYKDALPQVRDHQYQEHSEALLEEVLQRHDHSAFLEDQDVADVVLPSLQERFPEAVEFIAMARIRYTNAYPYALPTSEARSLFDTLHMRKSFLYYAKIRPRGGLGDLDLPPKFGACGACIALVRLAAEGRYVECGEALYFWAQSVGSAKRRLEESPVLGECDSLSVVEFSRFFPDDIFKRTSAANLALVSPVWPRPCGEAVSRSLLLPLLVSVYQDCEVLHDRTGTNKLQVTLVASVKFLAALGIFDFPVFGLLTKGAEGVVMYAWMSSRKHENEELQPVHIVERGCRSYDIRIPLDMWNYLSFLVYLRIVHAKELLRVLEEKRDTILEKFEQGDQCLKW